MVGGREFTFSVSHSRACSSLFAWILTSVHRANKVLTHIYFIDFHLQC